MLFFHNGAPVTADDVIYHSEAQDPSLKSPKRANWEGVAVEKWVLTKLDHLKQPYSSFWKRHFGNLPTFVSDIDSEQFSFSQYNVAPVGSGPLKLPRLKKFWRFAGCLRAQVV